MNRQADRSKDIPREVKVFASEREEIESAIATMRALLHYHRRMSMVSDPNYVADFYESALTCAIRCLEERLSRLC